MSLGVKLINYIRVVNKIEQHSPEFQNNIAKNLSYGVRSLAKSKEPRIMSEIAGKVASAPDTIKGMLLFVLNTASFPHSISHLQLMRKFLKVSCKQDPAAKEYMIGLKKYLLNTPKNKDIINFIGSGAKKYIRAYIIRGNSAVRKLRPNLQEYTATSKSLLDDLSQKSLYNHLENFFDYVINNGKVSKK